MTSISNDELQHLIQARVRRKARRLGANPQDIEDLTQEVFLAIWSDRSRIMQRWDESRGLPLVAFVGLVAEREAAKAIIRLARHRGSVFDGCVGDQDCLSEDHITPETVVVSRELLGQLKELLPRKLTQLGLRLFPILLVEQSSVSSACSETGLSPAAVYVWRNRLRTLVRSLGCNTEPDALKTRYPA